MRLVFCFLLLAASPAAAQPVDRDQASLISFADAFDQAQIAKDPGALEEMVSKKLVFVDGSGARLGKREFVAGWTAPGETYAPVVLEDRTITWLGRDAAIIGATTTLKGASAGKPFASRFRFADAFQRIKGRWRVVHIQVTRIPIRELPAAKASGTPD
jgi:ketosteroid isomerase-like protein